MDAMDVKFFLEAEKIFNEQVAERQRKEEALRKQQLENEQCIQNLNEEVSHGLEHLTPVNLLEFMFINWTL